MASGWLAIGDVQPLDGYCVFLADPVVESPNALDEAARIRYSLDVLRAGDALLVVTGAYRINYETLGNSGPALTRASSRRCGGRWPPQGNRPAMVPREAVWP